MVLDLESFNDHLYALVQNSSSMDISRTQVWEYQGATWINIGPPDTASSLWGAMAAFNGKLYVASTTSTPLSFLLAYDGSGWTNLETGQFGDTENLGITAMAVYQESALHSRAKPGHRDRNLAVRRCHLESGERGRVWGPKQSSCAGYGGPRRPALCRRREPRDGGRDLAI